MSVLPKNSWWTPEEELKQIARRKLEELDPLGHYGKWFLQKYLEKKPSAPRIKGENRMAEIVAMRDSLERATQLQRGGSLFSKPRTLGRYDEGEWWREEVQWESQPGLRVPATLLLPKGSPPFPAVVALHSMGSLRAFGREKLVASENDPQYLREYREKMYGGRSVMHDLARRGYAVIAIDSLLFGERVALQGRHLAEFLQQRREWDAARSFQFAQDTALLQNLGCFKAAMLAGCNWPGMILQDDISTLDYLVQRPEIDADRLGCVGLSLGGYRANTLAALDIRIKAAVSVCWLTTNEGLLGYNVLGGLGYFALLPDWLENYDLCDIPALACPRAFLAISGSRDHLMQPAGMVNAHHRLRKTWKDAGCPERLGSLVFDAPHCFNRRMQTAARLWLDRFLKEK